MHDTQPIYMPPMQEPPKHPSRSRWLRAAVISLVISIATGFYSAIGAASTGVNCPIDQTCTSTSLENGLGVIAVIAGFAFFITLIIALIRWQK